MGLIIPGGAKPPLQAEGKCGFEFTPCPRGRTHAGRVENTLTLEQGFFAFEVELNSF